MVLQGSQEGIQLSPAGTMEATSSRVTLDGFFFHKKLIPKIEFLDLSHNGVLLMDNLQVMSGD